MATTTILYGFKLQTTGHAYKQKNNDLKNNKNNNNFFWTAQQSHVYSPSD